MRVPLVLTSLEGIVFAVLSCKEFSVECSPIWPYQPNKTEKLFWILLRHDSNGIYERVLFPVNYIKIVPLLPASWMYRLGRLTEAYPDAVDIIIRSNPTTVSGELERALQDEVLRLRWRVSPLPRTSVLLTFPSGLCGWKICSMFPDYRNTFLKAPNSCLNHIIWLENCVCSSGTDHCTVKFAHPYNDTITVRFVFIARLEGNRLWEPYACCDSTGTKGTVLDSGSKITLGKLQKWSIIDNDEYARVMISNPFPDFSIAGGSPLSRIRIFLAQILFKDTPGPWEGR
ncbi:hypothetical protein OIDMADRAFT_20609 [Oidiodendron maius Zn]|uniref:Uncharacterized protein n=1 Tax=Oidiodendron maius (strain Zn) TaxID=913774 RepID=A0A0C3D6M8_OIDMZ|nr:hypothetical protein OIDMADRAFT_20609 [Oidiodendron maius Zn]